jgi:hypothetical protein
MTKWMGIIIVWLVAVPAWAGNASLLDGPQLAALLKSGKPCCVIDARSESLRKQAPIPFAVIHREGISIAQTSFAIVVADYDLKALEIAQHLVTSDGRDIYAVKGGYTTWWQIEMGVMSQTGAPRRFTIPSNTCEQGKALQEFK